MSEVGLISATAYANPGPSISFPASIQAGDLIIVADVAIKNYVDIPSPAYGDGFTPIAQAGLPAYTWVGGNPDAGFVDQYRYGRVNVSYKIATGDEAGAVIGGFLNGMNEGAVVVVYRAADPIGSVTVLDVDYYSGGYLTSPLTHVVSGSDSAAFPIIVGGVQASHSGLAPNLSFGQTPDTSQNDLATAGLLDSAFLQLASGSDVDVIFDDGASQVGISFYLKLEGEA